MYMNSSARTARISEHRIHISGPAGVEVLLRHPDGAPVEFLAGVPEITRFQTGFHPIYLLDLAFSDGTARTYFIDQNGVKLGEAPETLPTEVLAGLQQSVLGPDRPAAGFHRPDGDVGRLDEHFLADIVFITAVPGATIPDCFSPTLEPGWRVRFLFTGFAPLHLLELVHRDGRQATWYLSSEGKFLSHQVEGVPEPLRHPIVVFGVRRFLEEGNPVGLLRGFSFLNRRTRLDLEPYFPVIPARCAATGVGDPPPFENPLGHPPARGPMILVEQIDTEASSFDPERLTEGWSYREGGCWATSRDNVVLFSAPFAARRGRLTIDFQPGRSRRQVTVAVNGWSIGTSLIDPERGEDCRREFWIPAQAMQGRTLRCVLSFDDSEDFHACILRGMRLELGGSHDPAPLPDPRTLMTGFENIGDNCEFGLVQRYFGAEPLGLFRFADYGDFYNLIRLLESRFEGLGDAGTLSTQVISSIACQEHGVPETTSELYMHDLRRRYAFHTWKGPSAQSEPEALREAEHKLSYLCRKMIERLEQASRIWLVKRTRQTDVHEILALHAALRVYGPNRLFWVRASRPGRPAGSVEWISEGLLCGYSDQDHVHPHVFDPVRWLALCENAYRAFAAPQIRETDRSSGWNWPGVQLQPQSATVQ